MIIYTYFILSYFVSGQSFFNLLSFQFLRFDGNFFFCYILFFVFALPAEDYKKLANYYFKFIFIVFTIFSISGIIEYFQNNWSLMIHTEPDLGKVYFALDFAHNATGSVYAVVCIFLLVFFLKEKEKKLKLLYIILLLINLAALFLSKSRANYLGFIISSIIVIWLYYKSIKKFLIAIGIFIVGSIPVIYFTGAYNRFIQIFQIGKGTSIVRFFIWEKAWYLFSQSPLFGIGFGRFNDIFSIDRGLFDVERLKGFSGFITFYMKDNFYYDAAHVHNSYLQFLTETGVIGLSLVLLFWFLCLVKLLKYYNNLENSKNDFNKKVFLSAIGSIFVLLIISFFENYLSATTVMIPVSMLVPLAVGLNFQDKLQAQS
jgi:O-antigen ligase